VDQDNQVHQPACFRHTFPDTPCRERRGCENCANAIRLKPGSEERYKRYHAAVWPEVLSMIHQCNIRNYSIYLKDEILFSYFEYNGTDIKADWEKMAAHAKTQEWWAIMQPMQEPLSS